jgi:hypothetical protein
MGGVGRGTELHHIQVSYAFDDSYEWFGGTVDANHLVAFGGTDDDFDTDWGYRGNLQFIFSQRDPDWSDPTGESNGFESDNCSGECPNEPFTRPIFSNVTIVGPGGPDIGSYQYVIRHRRNSRLNLYNSVMMGFPWGIRMTEEVTKTAANAMDSLLYGCVSFQAYEDPDGGDAETSIHKTTSWPASDPITPGIHRFIHGGAPWTENNFGGTVRTMADVIGHEPGPVNYPDAVPYTDSEAATEETCWDTPVLLDLLDAGTFVEVGYRGAFAPGVPMGNQWTAGWTNFQPQNWDSETAVDEDGLASMPFRLLGNVPNPFNPKTAIRFALAEDNNVTLTVFDLTGRQVRDLAVSQHFPAGTHSITWDGINDAGMPAASGVYFYRLEAGSHSETQKMTLLK